MKRQEHPRRLLDRRLFSRDPAALSRFAFDHAPQHPVHIPHRRRQNVHTPVLIHQLFRFFRRRKPLRKGPARNRVSSETRPDVPDFLPPPSLKD